MCNCLRPKNNRHYYIHRDWHTSHCVKVKPDQIYGENYSKKV